MEALSIGPQDKLLLVGGFDKILKIYNNTGDFFTEIQSLWVGFELVMVRANEGNMVLSGLSNRIEFYSSDGSSYALTNTINVPDSKVFSFSITTDFTKLAYGSDNQTFNVYTRSNDTYRNEFAYEIGSEVKAVEMDETSRYYSACAVDGNLYTFYHCSTGCASCSFPDNCSECQEGYVLKGAHCFPKSTECVGNAVMKGEIC